MTYLYMESIEGMLQETTSSYISNVYIISMVVLMKVMISNWTL